MSETRRWTGHRRATIVACCVLFAGCLTETIPTGLGDEGYVAIITNAVGSAELPIGSSWTVRVSELSGTLIGDTVFTMAPRDTAVLTLPIATYNVTLDGLPVPCSLTTPTQEALVPERGTTWTVRYNVRCATLLAIETSTSGAEQFYDDAMVYRVRRGEELAFGSLTARDTARVDDLTPGEYVVELTHVRDECTITTPGGRRRPVSVAPPRTTLVSFGLICSDPALRPEVTHFASSRSHGFSVVYFEATDPGANGYLSAPDIDRFEWDMTDCHGFSVRESGQPVWRRGLRQSRIGGQSPARAISVIPTGELLPSDELCTSLRVVDAAGNTSRVHEEAVDVPAGRPPRVFGFNTVLAGAPAAPYLAFELDATDPDGDLVGGYLRLEYVDGSFVDPPDGISDVVVPTAVGFLGTEVPPIDPRATGLPLLEGLERVTVFVVDRQGNGTMWVDEDPLGLFP